MTAQLSPISAITLIVTRRDGSRSAYRSAGAPITIGRAGNNHLILSDEKVSRNHLRVDCRGGRIVIEDLGSRNGTHLNGKRIPPRKMVVANGKVTLGLTQIEFAINSHQEEVAELCEPQQVGTGDEAPTKISPVGNFHPRFKVELLSHFSKKVLSYQTYKKFAEISNHHNIAQSLAVLSQKATAILPDLNDINYLFMQNNSFFQADIDKMAASEFASCYQFVHDEQRAVLIKTVGDLEIVKRIIIPVKSNANLMFLMEMEVNKKLSQTQIEKLLELKTLVDFCAPSFESLLLRDELDQVFLKMLETIVITVEAKDTYTYGHSERVCRYATIIGEELDFTREQKKNLIISALCHDIGKIAIPDTILKKPTLLSVEEFEDMKSHPIIGAGIVRNIPNVEKFIGGIKHHHERWNGTGYPDRLKGENIPLLARIIALVDSFDAMTSGRTYIGFMNGDEAADRLTAAGHELFDPEILKIFATACTQGRIQKEHNTFLPF